MWAANRLLLALRNRAVLQTYKFTAAAPSRAERIEGKVGLGEQCSGTHHAVRWARANRIGTSNDFRPLAPMNER